MIHFKNLQKQGAGEIQPPVPLAVLHRRALKTKQKKNEIKNGCINLFELFLKIVLNLIPELLLLLEFESRKGSSFLLSNIAIKNPSIPLLCGSAWKGCSLKYKPCLAQKYFTYQNKIQQKIC